MMACSGARSANVFHNLSGVVPHPSSLTYEGLFAENYFKLQRLTDLVMDVEVSQAQVISPITGQMESWLGLIPKSKYDGVGMREPIDISVTLDISGSMGGSRIELAKEACFKLFSLLNAQDHIAFSTFNNQAHRIFPLTQGDEIPPECIDEVKKINVGGGTTVYNAIKDCYDILKESTNVNRRIIVVTDMEDNCKDDRLIKLMEQSGEEGIYVTFIGISYGCNTTLTEALAHVKGSNYFVANKNEEIEKYLVNDFKFICFPCAHNVQLEVRSNSLKAVKCVGTGFNIPKEHKGQEEWKLKSHHTFDSRFKGTVNFMLSYFKRLNKRMPMPVLDSFNNYFRFDKKTVCDIKTMFPSGLATVGNEHFVEGGMILIKLEKELTVPNNYFCHVRLNYTTNEGSNYAINYPIYFDNFATQKEFYSDQNIKNALSLNYYVKYCKSVMKAENSISKKKTSLAVIKEERRLTIDQSSEAIEEYIRSNMSEFYTKEKQSGYLERLKQLVKKVHENIEIDEKNRVNRRKFDEEQKANGQATQALHS